MIADTQFANQTGKFEILLSLKGLGGENALKCILYVFEVIVGLFFVPSVEVRMQLMHFKMKNKKR